MWPHSPRLLRSHTYTHTHTPVCVQRLQLASYPGFPHVSAYCSCGKSGYDATTVPPHEVHTVEKLHFNPSIGVGTTSAHAQFAHWIWLYTSAPSTRCYDDRTTCHRLLRMTFLQMLERALTVAAIITAGGGLATGKDLSRKHDQRISTDVIYSLLSDTHAYFVT